MSEPFPNVTGAGRYQTERDFDAAERTRDIRAKRNRRLRQHLTVDTDDSTAVLYRCGCVAAVKPSERDAKEFLDWQNDNPHTDRAKWDGAYLTPAYSRWDHAVLRVFDRDDVELPVSGHRSSAGCETHASRFDRRGTA